MLAESLVDQAAKRLFTHSIQLGMYDPDVSYRSWGAEVLPAITVAVITRNLAFLLCS